MLNVRSFSMMLWLPCCISLPTLDIAGYGYHWIQLVSVPLPLIQHMVTVCSLQTSSKVQHDEMEPFPSFGGCQCLRLFLPATQIHLLELPPANPNRLMDLLRPRFSGVSRDFKNYTHPASVNVLFLSLNELEIDTLSFEFRPQSRHQSLNVLLGGSIFYYAVWIKQK